MSRAVGCRWHTTTTAGRQITGDVDDVADDGAPGWSNPCPAADKRVGPDHALELPALVLAQTGEGIAVANGDFDGPAVAILPQDVLQAEREIRGEEGFDWGRRFALAWLFGTGGGATDRD